MGLNSSIPTTIHIWSGRRTTTNNNKQLLKMVEALLSWPLVGQPQSPNPTSSVKDMEVALASGSTEIQTLEVKQARASQEAAAGSRNFSRSTGRPMGRPSEPRGTRPWGRSNRQRAVQEMKRIRMPIAGMEPGPPPPATPALFFKRLLVCKPCHGKANREARISCGFQKVLRSSPPRCCAIRHCTEEVPRQGEDRVEGGARHGEASQLRRKGAEAPGGEQGRLHRANRLECPYTCLRASAYLAGGLAKGRRQESTATSASPAALKLQPTLTASCELPPAAPRLRLQPALGHRLC